MWTDEIKNNLYHGLETQLDNKSFYDASSLYGVVSTAKVVPKADLEGLASLGHISFSSKTPTANFTSNSIHGMAFSNQIEKDQKVNSVKDLPLGGQKIYKIADLLSANFAETTVIPLSTIPTNMSLVKRFQWKDVWFADVGEAFSMIKNRFFK